ncbi:MULTISPECIES: zinc-dependent alcohol dehydrogenase family protein [unclassified Rhizobium]|uniref:zinc-dependent alcohol dehydrogenase family protein n=1 Tax=unclassified Rhizobium TaxID=2613769 RepID=UPI002167FB41|nr:MULTISPECIES: zinc-dependent alcohol dehydrogenase family protein [unclassified Rhizobium]MCS3743219.1 propanol-preferring alcohol dehydrogenase [Rhizobium sp. BK661]MCS4096353.1 propanol-preferring alcohol dehydrogenase [Rhizobium sp. BK176]
MRTMVLEEVGSPLRFLQAPDPRPAKDQVLLRVEACGVCRTDLHVVEGALPDPKLPLVLGHEIVGEVIAIGPGVAEEIVGKRVGVPWLGHTCGCCHYCLAGAENLCDSPGFTGYTLDGGYATHAAVDVNYSFVLPHDSDPVATAPLLCAGLIGWRSLKMAGEAKTIGLYGFGAAAHILAQVCKWRKQDVYAFVRPGDEMAKRFALDLGAVWAGASNEAPPAELDAAIIFAPAGELVPAALARVRKGGTVVCGGIHMSDIPRMPYQLLWGERHVVSVANLTRADAREFFDLAGHAGLRTVTTAYPLERANDALADLRGGLVKGAAVLVP